MTKIPWIVLRKFHLTWYGYLRGRLALKHSRKTYPCRLNQLHRVNVEQPEIGAMHLDLILFPVETIMVPMEVDVAHHRLPERLLPKRIGRKITQRRQHVEDFLPDLHRILGGFGVVNLVAEFVGALHGGAARNLVSERHDAVTGLVEADIDEVDHQTNLMLLMP